MEPMAAAQFKKRLCEPAKVRKRNSPCAGAGRALGLSQIERRGDCRNRAQHSHDIQPFLPLGGCSILTIFPGFDAALRLVLRFQPDHEAVHLPELDAVIAQQMSGPLDGSLIVVACKSVRGSVNLPVLVERVDSVLVHDAPRPALAAAFF
jgi:hypothetical protein